MTTRESAILAALLARHKQNSLAATEKNLDSFFLSFHCAMSTVRCNRLIASCNTRSNFKLCRRRNLIPCSTHILTPITTSGVHSAINFRLCCIAIKAITTAAITLYGINVSHPLVRSLYVFLIRH